MHTLYTIGYTSLTPDLILKKAIDLDALIADIRISPLSRVPHWTKAQLERAWTGRYIHIRELGNKNYKGEFGEGVLLVDPDEGANRVIKLLGVQPVMLMCACKDWQTCHRKNAAQEIADRYGVEVIHLLAADVRPQQPSNSQLPLF